MYKLLYYTDTQFRGKSPRNRIDNFTDAIKAKITEVYKIAKKEKVDRIIHGGDVFDFYLVANTLSDWYIDLIDKYKIPTDMVAGNHDEYYNNWELSSSTSLAHMFRRSPYINQLTEFENDEVYIKGQEFYEGIEEDLNKKFPRHNKKDKVTIYVPHAMITDVPVWFTKCIYYKNVSTNYNLVLVSHNHKYWGIKKDQCPIFAAPGAIARINADEYDINRKPSVVLIEIKDKQLSDLKMIPLKCAKSDDEVFDLQKIAIQDDNAKKLEQFTEGLKNIKFKTMKVIDTVMQVCDESKVEDTVKESLRKTLSEGE